MMYADCPALSTAMDAYPVRHIYPAGAIIKLLENVRSSSLEAAEATKIALVPKRFVRQRAWNKINKELTKYINKPEYTN